MEITWRELTGCIIDADRVNLLLERETMKECKLMIDHEENKLEFTRKIRRYWKVVSPKWISGKKGATENDHLRFLKKTHADRTA